MDQDNRFTTNHDRITEASPGLAVGETPGHAMKQLVSRSFAFSLLINGTFQD
jgi:hypothetical protein